MNSSPRHLDPTAEEQAALWAARLDGSEISAAERAALHAWMAENPAHRALLSEYCQFSADLEQQLPLIAGIKEQSAGVPPAPKTARSSPWSRWPVWAGVALTTAAAAALALLLASPRSQSENIASAIAQRQQLTLADGTRVELNARTALLVDLQKKERHVRLASGQAFFTVSKDASRPFVVETPAGSVRVTGTQFDVRTEDGPFFEVTVAEGSVQVHPAEGASAAGPIALRAGDQLSSGPRGTSRHALKANELADTLSWRDGRAVFRNTPLREALARFARYHGRGLTATDDAAELSVGGQYGLDDLDGFLAGLEASQPVRVTRDLNGAITVSRRTDR